MDKDLLRIVIIALGALVVAGMWLWHVLRKGSKVRRRRGFFQDDEVLDSIDESLVIKAGDDDFEIVPLGSAIDDAAQESAAEAPDDQVPQAEPSISGLPRIIQFSIVSRAEDGFNGMDLAAALDAVGLRYADIKIYERVDSNNLVDFGVASMVPPGTFPESNLADFNCPGIVLFMQPREVDDPAAVFDDFVKTMHRLASKLDGIERDETQQPLSEEKIQRLREQMIQR